jgi:hypothetical protein
MVGRFPSPASLSLCHPHAVAASPELEELAVDPGSTPQRIGKTHFPDQLANFEWHLWSAAARSRLHRQNKRKPARCQRMIESIESA